MQYRINTELSSLEETRRQFYGGTDVIQLGIDLHQDFYVVVMQEGGSNPKPPQRRIRLGRLPRFFFQQKIALIKLLLRLRSQVRIGVRAAGNKTNEQIRKRKRSKKTSTAINKAYELTTPSTTLARNA